MRRVLFALLPLLVLVALAEGIGRVLVPPRVDRAAAFPRSHPGPAFVPAGPGGVRPAFQDAAAGPPFAVAPGPRVPRVFVFGESSVRGGVRGIRHEEEFPALLIGRLRPEVGPVEVINLGKPGVDLPGIVELAGAAAAYAPDVVVLYAGHNDVGNATMRALVPDGRRPARPAWEASGAFRLLRWGLATRVPPRPPTLPADPDLAARFGAALDRFLDVWNDAHVPVVVATPASDLWRWSPGAPGCPSVSRAAWTVGRDGRWTLADDVPDALAARILAAAPACPEAAFLEGRARARRGDPTGLDLLRAARDADPTPLRADSRVLGVLRATTGRPGVHLVDVEDAWGREGPLVSSRFHDLVHFERSGHIAMAETLAPAVADALRAAPRLHDRLGPPGPDDLQLLPVDQGRPR